MTAPEIAGLYFDARNRRDAAIHRERTSCDPSSGGRIARRNLAGYMSSLWAAFPISQPVAARGLSVEPTAALPSRIKPVAHEAPIYIPSRATRSNSSTEISILAHNGPENDAVSGTTSRRLSLKMARLRAVFSPR
jgi:hypothetical protein